LTFQKTVFQDIVNESATKNKRDVLLKIGFANQTYIAFIVQALEDILNQEIVSRIQTKMKSKGFSHKISDSVHIAGAPVAKNPGLIAWTIISDYKALDGFPVAVMIEDGRKAYTVVPLDPEGWLHWIAKDGSEHFSKKSKIPRFAATKFVRDTVKERLGIVQEKVDLATQRYIDDILNDNPLP